MGQPANPKVKPISAPPLERPSIQPAREALPKGATGALPEHDGDPFHVNLPGGEAQVTPGQARRVVEQIAAAFGWKGGPGDFRVARDEGGGQQVLFFEQRYRGTRVEYADVRALIQPGRGLKAVTGRLFARIAPSNRQALSEAKGVAAARAHVSAQTRLAQRPVAKAEPVLLPYGAAFKFAWRVEVPAQEGDYRLWIDAETGRVLQLEPLFSTGK